MAVDLSSYRDQHFKGSRSEQERLLHQVSQVEAGLKERQRNEVSVAEPGGADTLPLASEQPH